jgi:large subunit ribosomal protein L4
LALCSAFTLKRKEDKLLVLDKIELQEVKTKAFLEILNQLGVEQVLIIDQDNVNLERSARNVPFVKVLRPEGLNLYDILYYQNLVVTQSCLEKIQGRLI